jgi:hypothetical protein
MMPNRKETIVANNPGPCPSCPAYGDCTQICEKVEMWTDQDNVGRRGNLLLENRIRTAHESGLDDFVDYCAFCNQDQLEPDKDVSYSAWSDIRSMNLSDKMVRFIYSYYMLGKRVRDIAIDEGVSSQAIDQRHIQAKKSVARRLNWRGNWIKVRDTLHYKSIRDYDVCYLFFSAGYTKKAAAKIMGLHVTTVIKIISNKNKELDVVFRD